MSRRLFIELYLDEDVDILVAQLVRTRGYRATTTVEAGLLAATDEQHLITPWRMVSLSLHTIVSISSGRR